MFGFIKNFFGGIFGFFARLLGLQKSEYFMDLGDSSAKEPAKVEPATAKKAEPVAVAATPAPEKVAPAKSATAQKAEPTKKAKKGKESAASVPAKSSEPAKVAAAAATNGKVSSQSEPILTFAPNNLMPTSNASRRGPGPSMNGFREMARQVKTK
jgi:cytoskeletal protein RodZ